MSNFLSSFKNYISQVLQDDCLNDITSDYYTVDEFNKKHENLSADSILLSVIHVNIRSLNANYSKLQQLLSELDVKLDVIILTEIWKTNVQFYSGILPGYRFFYDLPLNSNVGGVGIFVKNDLPSTVRNDLIIRPMNYSMENVFLEIEKAKITYLIGGLYRHPNHNIKCFSDDIDNLFHKLNSFKHKSQHLVLQGDINIDAVRYSSHPDTTTYIDMILSNNFLPLTFLPTRITDTSSTAIDHIYMKINPFSLKNYKIATGLITFDLSDHLINYLILESNKVVNNYAERPLIRLYSDKTKQSFYSKLQSLDWTDIFADNTCPSELYNKFSDSLTSLYDEFFPLVKQSRKSYKDKLWMTKGLKNSSETKQRLYKKWLLNRNDFNKSKYLNYKKIFTKLIKKSEIDYYTNIFKSRVTSVKNVWRQINILCSFSKKKNSAQKIINKMRINGNITSDPKEIANCFNTYFCEVGVNLSLSVPPSPIFFTEYLPPPIKNSFYCSHSSPNEIVNEIHRLQNKKSSGPDIFNTKILKFISQEIAGPLSYIFNLSIDTGIFPDKMKVAKVIPILKKGDPLMLGNYRPISLLPVFSKVFEKLIASRLLLYLNKYSIISDNQFGFRQKHSTVSALLNTVDDIYSEFDSNNLIIGIFFDICKAFDCVNFGILLKKLECYGIRGISHKWFSSYLFDRKQYVCINGINSDIKAINCGVPQGSVLGPLLFLLYINDIANIQPLEKPPKLFADDTSLFVTGKNSLDIESKCNKAILLIQDWMSANKLTVNTDKTCYLQFISNNKNNQQIVINLLLNGVSLQRVDTIKFLGVTFDSRLDWKEHIKEIFSSLLKFTSIFYKLRNKIPLHTIKSLYYSTVYPKILYGIEIYANTYPTHLNSLIVLNNKILRIAQSKPLHTPILSLYREFNTLPIDLLFKFNILQFTHKLYYHKNLLPAAFRSYFRLNSEIHEHDTRSKTLVHLSQSNKMSGTKNLNVFGSRLWNTLPIHISSTVDISLFKTKIKNYLYLENT